MKPGSQHAGQTFLGPVPPFSRGKWLGQELHCPLPSKEQGRLQSFKCVSCQRSVQSCVGAGSPVLELREPECLVAAGYLKLELRLSVYLFISRNFGFIPITVSPAAALIARIMICFEKCLKRPLSSIETTPGSCSFMSTS